VDGDDEDCPDPPPVPRDGVIASPVLEDLTGNGKLEIIQAGLDGTIHVFSVEGESIDGWPVNIEADADLERPVLTTPTVVDLNDDSVPDLVVPASLGGGTGSYVAIDGRGTLADELVLPGWPVDVVDWPLGASVQGATPGAASAGDFSGDGQAEVVLHGNVSVPFILPAAPGAQSSPEALPEGSWPVRDPATGARGIEYTGRFGAESNADPSQPMFPMLARPSLGDLDQDGTPDVVTSGASRDVAKQLATGVPVVGPDEYLLAFWNGTTGAMFPGSPSVVSGSPWYGDAAIADISGDRYPEVITGTDGFLVHAVDACGRAPSGWPKATGQWVTGAPAVGDLDGDKTLEVVVTTRNGWLFAWHTSGSQDGTIAWASQHHDNRNTGSLATELGQGAPRTATRPLFISVGGRCVTPGGQEEPEVNREFSPAGGCACETESRTPRPASFLVLLGASLALARRRRRPPDSTAHLGSTSRRRPSRGLMGSSVRGGEGRT
jgi:MYXO-CTERM domain-containing protein